MTFVQSKISKEKVGYSQTANQIKADWAAQQANPHVTQLQHYLVWFWSHLSPTMTSSSGRIIHSGSFSFAVLNNKRNPKFVVWNKLVNAP